MNTSPTNLYTNPFARAFTGMTYASKADLDNVPRIVYHRYRWMDHRMEEFDLLIADVPLEIWTDGIGNDTLEIMGWKITEEQIYGDKMGYSIPESHESCERVSLYMTDTFSFYYKNIVVGSNGLDLRQFRDKISPYITLAYTEAALDRLG